MANLYDRNADEFTDSMTALVELDTEGGKQKVRIFSLRGCHLLGMLSRTKIAKEFRKWVLDVLERHTQPRYGVLDLPEPPTITKSQAGQLFAIVSNKSDSSGKPRAYFWSRYQNHFKLASYKDTPADRFDEAMDYLRRLEGDEADAFMMLTQKELAAIVKESAATVGKLDGELLQSRQAYSTITISLNGGANMMTLIFEGRADVAERYLVDIYDKAVSINKQPLEVVTMTEEKWIRYMTQERGYLVIKKGDVLPRLEA